MANRNPWLDDSPSSNTRNGNFDPNHDYLQEHCVMQKSTLESQQRSLRILAETEQVGADTAVELKRQGEVLNRAETKVDNINENLNVAEYHVRTIKSWWGGWTNRFRKQPTPKSQSQEEEEHNMQGQSIGSINAHREAESASEVVNSMNRQDHVNSVRNQNNYKNTGQSNQYDLYENQIESNLDQMSSGLSRLREQGLTLQTELGSQNTQLDRLNNKMETVDSRTGKVNAVLRRLND